MKLDRNINSDGHGKYGLINNRKLAGAKDIHSPQGLMAIEHAVHTLEVAGIIDWGLTPETEFFLIKLKDKYADSALTAYALEALKDDVEYGGEVGALASRSGRLHPLCKKPD